MRYFLSLMLLLGVGWGQILRKRGRCTGAACAENLRIEERRRSYKVRRQAEAQRERRRRMRHWGFSEDFRPPVYTPRHKPRDYERMRPPDFSVPHSQRAEAFRPKQQRLRHIQRAEAFRPRTKRIQRYYYAEDMRMRPYKPSGRVRHRAEAFRPPYKRIKRYYYAEDMRPPQTEPSGRVRRRAEAFRPPKRRMRHYAFAEELRPPRAEPSGRVRRLAEKVVPPLPIPMHKQRAERFVRRPPRMRHYAFSEDFVERPPKIKHKRLERRLGCEPEPVPHTIYDGASCEGRFPTIRHRLLEQKQTCRPRTPSREILGYAESQSCQPPHIKRRNFDRYRCAPPYQPDRPLMLSRMERRSCEPPRIPHKSFDEFQCAAPIVRHRHPSDYQVPCDAQRQGTMSNMQRLSYDVRYLFTNHRKNCDLSNAYAAVSLGEWVNSPTYGRVPVAGYIMGKRVEVLAYYYDKKGNILRKPRLKKRKFKAVKQIEVWVPEGEGAQRKWYERFSLRPSVLELPDGQRLIRKRLSLEESRMVQIEKLVRKRQIAWLVRAFPEERPRLRQWIEMYAGPTPPYFWPTIDYRLLEVW
ncbi:MAG: hypothetical protein NZ580_05030 [Bacteroidia bacterium]|nr:hypothetical protein [Bacteroidia bacterium]MDW8235816.1 hypothetical protein [Bacteroidia bacterium]